MTLYVDEICVLNFKQTLKCSTQFVCGVRLVVQGEAIAANLEQILVFEFKEIEL